MILFYFTLRLLTIREIIDNVVIEINYSIKLNRKRRLKNSNNINEIYINFINIDLDINFIIKTYHEKKLIRII